MGGGSFGTSLPSKCQILCGILESLKEMFETCPVILCSAIGEGAGGIGGGAGMVDITGGA